MLIPGMAKTCPIFWWSNFRPRVSQRFHDFLGYFENISFKVKPDVASFAQLLVTIGLIYNLASGHTGQQMNVA